MSLLSFVGVFALSLSDKTLKKAVFYFVALAIGGLMGDAFLHLLPEATEKFGNGYAYLYVLTGFFLFLAIEKVIHWRHCHEGDCAVHAFTQMSLIGDGVHNFIDGVVIGASYLVSVPVGLATTLAVVFHEVPQELGDFGILMHTGLSKARALWYNFLFGLTSVVGAVLVVVIGKAVEELIPLMLPFAAGSFVYIASSDLIPELHKNNKNFGSKDF